MSENKIKVKRSVEPSMFMSRLAEQAERYDDMFDFLKEVIINREPCHFTQDERNLMSHAFKNLITPKRQTWRTLISQKKQNEDEEGS